MPAASTVTAHRPVLSPVTQPTLSVVICAYTEERWTDLVEAVASVHVQTLPAREVIVVVDHNPRLLARVRSEITGIHAIPNGGAPGLSGGRNTGVAAASGDVVAFMDDDAVAEPEWLESLAPAYLDPAVEAAGGSIHPLWEEERPRWFPLEFNWVVGCTYLGMPTQRSDVRNLIGCNMSFRRATLLEIGGFRVGLGRVRGRPVGGEETEISIRLTQRHPGARIVYDPAARVGHRVPKARARFAYFRSRCYAEGLSKAVITQLVGGGDGLSSERAYTLRTIPLGFFRGIRDTLRGDGSGIRRSAALAAGVLVTTAGYLAGRVTRVQHLEATSGSRSNAA
jgi:glycosyltransferase involved in cell wall biosynthesis